MTRAGWTLHEMLVSLSVMAVAAGLAAHAAVVQLRFFRGAGEIVAVRGQDASVGAVLAAAIWGVSAAAGDIQFASDSAVEIRTSIGNAVACDAGPGRVVLPAPEPTGNSLSGFDAPPDAGDILDAYVTDSISAGWIRTSVTSTALGSGVCPAFPQSHGTIDVTLRDPLTLPQGSLLRFSRPIRFSHYRASDGQWYFGARDWSGASLRLNTVQPVAGPLEPHSSDPAKSGLVLRFFDSSATELPQPIDPLRIAIISVVSRGRSGRPVALPGRTLTSGSFLDSSVTIIGLRNLR